MSTYPLLYPLDYGGSLPPLGLTASVHEPDGTHLADLPRLAGWDLVDAESEPGTGEVSVLARDATPNVLEQGNVVRVALGGMPVRSFVVAPPSTIDLVSVEERTVKLSGQGVAALLHGVTVQPENGLGWAPRERPFNWVSKHFVPWGDVTWSSPATHGTAAAPANTEWEQVRCWPEIANHAEWMAAGTPTGGAAPAYVYPPIYQYFRLTLPIPEAMDVGYFITGDDEVDLYAATELLVRTEGTMQWRDTHQPERIVHHEAGEVQLAIRARNLPRPDSEFAPDSAAGVLFAACRLNAVGEPVEVLAVSGPDWEAVGDPPHPPGMTPGHKMRLLIDEGQARGCVPGVTLDFDDETATPRPGESLGETWLDDTDTHVEHGRTLLDVLGAEAQTSVDWHMTADQVLQMWGRDRRYADLTGGNAPVRLEPGRDIVTMTAGPMRRRVNALTVETSEGWYAEVTDDASILAHDRTEGFRRLGEQDLPGSATGPAEQVIADSGDPTPTATVELAPDCRYTPYLDFTVGDWLRAPGITTTWAAWRLIVVRCTPASDFRPRWTLTLEYLEAL